MTQGTRIVGDCWNDYRANWKLLSLRPTKLFAGRTPWLSVYFGSKMLLYFSLLPSSLTTTNTLVTLDQLPLSK